MKREEVYEALDKIRKVGNHPFDKIANYIEANMDDFIECYEEIEKISKG